MSTKEIDPTQFANVTHRIREVSNSRARIYFRVSFPHLGPPAGSNGKEFAHNVGDLGSIPGSGRSSRKENGNPLQYSCLENSMNRGAWQATVHGVAELDMTERLTLPSHC